MELQRKDVRVALTEAAIDALAGFHGHADTIRTLLESGAVVGVRDREGFTALMWAVRNGHSAVAELLKKAGAKE